MDSQTPELGAAFQGTRDPVTAVTGRTAALVVDVQSFEGMARADAIAFSDAVARKLYDLRAARVPVIWIGIAPGGSKLLEPRHAQGQANEVREKLVLQSIGFLGHRDNYDVYRDFMRHNGPRENEAVYRKPTMSALATCEDTPDQQRLLWQAGIKLEQHKDVHDHPETVYIRPDEQATAFARLFKQGSSLHDYLQRLGITNTYILGTVSKYCVTETAISAAIKGYKTEIATDLVLSRKFPGTDRTQDRSELVWAGYDHTRVIRTAIADAVNDPERQYTPDEKNGSPRSR